MIALTESQQKELNKLWFIYGNNGKKSTHSNHRFIQNLLTRGEDNRKFYLDGIQNMRDKGYSEEKIMKDAITQECIDAVDKILNTTPMKKVIDGDNMQQIGTFMPEDEAKTIEYYESLGKWGSVSTDHDGDIILFEDADEE